MGLLHTCSKLVHRLWWIFHLSLHLSPPLPVNCSDPQIFLLRMQISYLKFLTLIVQWNNDQNKHFSLRQNAVMICVLLLPPNPFAAYATSLLCSSPDACCGVIVAYLCWGIQSFHLLLSTMPSHHLPKWWRCHSTCPNFQLKTSFWSHCLLFMLLHVSVLIKHMLSHYHLILWHDSIVNKRFDWDLILVPWFLHYDQWMYVSDQVAPWHFFKAPLSFLASGSLSQW